MAKSKKYKTPGNPNWSDYHIQPAVPGKSKNKLLAIKVDENLLANLKSMDGWQDKVRAKLEELLQEEQATASTEKHPTGGGAGVVVK